MRVFVVLKSLNKVNKQLCSVHNFTTEGLILATSTILKYKGDYSPNMFHIIILSRVNINIGDHYSKNWIVSIDEINRTIKLSNNSEPIKYKPLI